MLVLILYCNYSSFKEKIYIDDSGVLTIKMFFDFLNENTMSLLILDELFIGVRKNFMLLFYCTSIDYSVFIFSVFIFCSDHQHLFTDARNHWLG